MEQETRETEVEAEKAKEESDRIQAEKRRERADFTFSKEKEIERQMIELEKSNAEDPQLMIFTALEKAKESTKRLKFQFDNHRLQENDLATAAMTSYFVKENIIKTSLDH